MHESFQLEPLFAQKILYVVIDSGYLNLVGKQVSKPFDLFALFYKRLFGSRQVLTDDAALRVLGLELLNFVLDLCRFSALFAVQQIVRGKDQQAREKQQHCHLPVPRHSAEETARSLFCALSYSGHRRCHKSSPSLALWRSRRLVTFSARLVVAATDRELTYPGDCRGW